MDETNTNGPGPRPHLQGLGGHQDATLDTNHCRTVCREGRSESDGRTGRSGHRRRDTGGSTVFRSLIGRGGDHRDEDFPPCCVGESPQVLWKSKVNLWLGAAQLLFRMGRYPADLRPCLPACFVQLGVCFRGLPRGERWLLEFA